MTDEVLKIINNSNEQVVLEVNAKDPLTVALHPYLSSEYKYITVTKGMTHILTIVREDGSTFSFHWGYTGHTLISADLERLKQKVLEVIKNNYISIEQR